MAKSIAEKLSNTLESLAELRIATGVGEFQLDISEDSAGGGMKVRPSQTTQLDGLYTEVNLVSGDVITLIHASYKDKDDPVFAMHQAQVENGRRIVATNVATIRDLLSSASEKIQDALNNDSRSGG